jgi:hypothetical protein
MNTVTATALLDSWTAFAWDDGLQVDRLHPLESLTVFTHNSRYEIVILAAEEARVLVRGGSFFPDFTPAHVAGSTLGGSFLKQRGIYAGFQMELTSGCQRIVTSRVRRVVRHASDQLPVM